MSKPAWEEFADADRHDSTYDKGFKIPYEREDAIIIPKTIKQKIERLNSLLLKADLLRYEIEEWAKKKGIDTNSEEWYGEVVDDTSSVNGIYLEGLEELLNNRY